jgi:hypothetical protein
MKKVIKLILFLLLIIILIIFYDVYLTNDKNIKVDNLKEQPITTIPKNNLIKNLKYEVNLDKKNKYVITSNLSEITYENSVEIVKMQKVIAIFSDQKNIPLIITSDLASFNNSNYNTKFSKNVRVEYLDNIISSDQIDFDYSINLIRIHQNVEYKGIQGHIVADNIEIDLLKKEIEIYMDNTNDNVEVTAKQ